MPLADYQKQIDEGIESLGLAKPYWDPLSQLAALTEEVGELARILNHRYGDKPKKPDDIHNHLDEELADILCVVLCLANTEGINLDDALQKSIAKITTRDKDRYEKN